jgi:hypothetical protein
MAKIEGNTVKVDIGQRPPSPGENAGQPAFIEYLHISTTEARIGTFQASRGRRRTVERTGSG